MLPPLHRLGANAPHAEPPRAAVATGVRLGGKELNDDEIESIVAKFAESGESEDLCETVRNWLVARGFPVLTGDLSENTYREFCKKFSWVWSKATALPGFTWSKWFKRVCFYTKLGSEGEMHESNFNSTFDEYAHIIANADRVIQYGRKNDKEVVLAAVTKDGTALKYASRELRNNREVVLVAVTQMGFALEYASKDLRDDKEVVLAAVTEFPTGAMRVASDRLKADREIMLAAVLADESSGPEIGSVLEFAPDVLRDDRELVLAAVRVNGKALEFASDRLQNDREVVLEAVRQDGMALEWTLPSMKNDREVVLAAARQDGFSLMYASEALKEDKEVVLAAVRSNVFAYGMLSDELQEDPEVRAALKKSRANARGQMF